MLRRATTRHTIPELSKEPNRIPSTTSNLSEPATAVDSRSSTETNGLEWAVSFGAMMVPFAGFLYFHKLGYFNKSLEVIAKSRFGVHGFLALPFVTLSIEKCIYDTVQSLQGIDPNVVPEGRGGFPSGGAALPSLSLVAVRKKD